MHSSGSPRPTDDATKGEQPVLSLFTQARSIAADGVVHDHKMRAVKVPS